MYTAAAAHTRMRVSMTFRTPALTPAGPDPAAAALGGQRHDGREQEVEAVAGAVQAAGLHAAARLLAGSRPTRC